MGWYTPKPMRREIFPDSGIKVSGDPVPPSVSEIHPADGPDSQEQTMNSRGQPEEAFIKRPATRSKPIKKARPALMPASLGKEGPQAANLSVPQTSSEKGAKQ